MAASPSALGSLTALGDAGSTIDAALGEVQRARVIERIWQKDHTVWKPDSTEITNRLGWLDVARDMRAKAGDMEAFGREIRSAGFRHVVLLGMGGSSLCPEVLRATFGSRHGYPQLIVLDSTVAARVRRVTQSIDPARTLFIVSSKSGGTIEVMSLFKHFWSRVEKQRRSKAGQNFIAITDPNTRLGALAAQHGFYRTFLNPPDIGGRYSALSYFGLVPAALIGLDLPALLDPALAMMDACRVYASANPAAQLGAAMSALARAGRDKLSLLVSPSIAAFGLWAEQLLAESTGKDGRGIVPIAIEPFAPPQAYSSDRLFVVLRVQKDKNSALDRHVAALKAAGHPVLAFDLADRHALGAEFFRWEMATAVAGHLLGIQPFDQPNVQESKDYTQRALDKYKASGALPTPDELPGSPHLAEFLAQARPGDYVGLMAYLDETPDVDAALAELRAAILARCHLPNTLGYGPRYLHSTGQLHKGGSNHGLFIQLAAKTGRDVPIPGELFSFGVLAAAQASGDLASLRAHARRVIRIDLGANPVAGIRRLTRSIGGSVGVAQPAARKTARRKPAAAAKPARQAKPGRRLKATTGRNKNRPRKSRK